MSNLPAMKVGSVGVREFDLGVVQTMGCIPDLTDRNAPCYVLPEPGESSLSQSCSTTASSEAAQRVKVFFSQPEQIFRLKIYPFITINRDEMTPSTTRYMGVEQMDYRKGVSGTQATAFGKQGFTEYENKLSAQPYDFVYTISIFDRYEAGAQAILHRVLKLFPPIGRLNVIDSLGVSRSYDAYMEGGVVSLQEAIDPVTRVRGYAITLRVEGEIDLTEPYTTGAVTDFGINLNRLR